MSYAAEEESAETHMCVGQIRSPVRTQLAHSNTEGTVNRVRAGVGAD